MTTYKHDPVYDDVIYLQKHGTWPNCVVPPWADERSTELECYPTASTILLMAADFEIQRLRAHNCCDHNRPNGLVSRAAFDQVVEELNKTIEDRDRALKIVDDAVSYHDLKNRLHVSSELGIKGTGSPLSWKEIDERIDALRSDIAEAQQAWNKICSIFDFDPCEETWDSLPEKLEEFRKSNHKKLERKTQHAAWHTWHNAEHIAPEAHPGKGAFIPGLGRIRPCDGCGCLIVGDATRCKNCTAYEDLRKI